MSNAPESTLPEGVWQLMQQRLGYSDEELETFRSDPRNHEVLAAGARMATKTIVFEVVKSRGCNALHKEGDKFYFTGDGLLLTRKSPRRICAFVMPVMTQAIMGIHELMYAGVDPNEMRFRRASCFDVGLECGGWGNIVVEARVEDRRTAAGD
jgi:uncharacterized repeat protein (TIGR04076 family)